MWHAGNVGGSLGGAALAVQDRGLLASLLVDIAVVYLRARRSGA